MDKLTDETFFAWLDGELGGAEAAEVERRVAADPRLSQRASEHRALARRLRGAFDPIAATPVPEHVAAPPRAADNVVGLRRWTPKGGRPAPRALPQWAAMAATLALGMFVGTLLSPGGDQAPVQARGGALYAAASLDRALDRHLASAPSGDIRIGLTFRDQAGAICRSFTGDAASGLACRDGEDWRLRGMFGTPEGKSGDYRMAAGGDPALAELVASTMAGEAFDAEQEAKARQNGWR